jgi:cysteine synthase A
MRIFGDNLESVGGTPLIEVKKLKGPSRARLMAKIEGRNPGYSVKCRPAAAMIIDAEKRGLLGPGREIVEPTSGNTGIALAAMAASRGYRCTLIMPDTMSMERRKLLKVFGANLILTPGAAGMRAAVDRAREIAASEPDRYYLPDQFSNPANADMHEKTTGPEIWNDTEGGMDVFVSGVGTGGTITGVSRYFKKTKGKRVLSVAVEPEESPVITQTLAGRRPVPGMHKIQGIGAGFVPGNLDLSLVDRVETVGGEEAMEFTSRMCREEGILAGISGGAAAAAAVRLAGLPEMQGKMIVFVLPDAGERYLSTALFEKFFGDV